MERPKAIEQAPSRRGLPTLSLSNPPNRILLIKLSSIGDVVHTLPSAFALARRWPEARMDWLVDPSAAEIVRLLSFVDRVVELDSLARRFRGVAGLRHFRSVIGTLRAVPYDLVVDFQGLLRSSVWTLLSGAAVRVGRGRWPWLHARVPMVSPSLTPHAIENTARALVPLGFEPSEICDRFLESEALALRARVLLAAQESAREFLEGGPFWVWIPSSSWPSKSLPLEEAESAAIRDSVAHLIVGDESSAYVRVPARGRWRNLSGRLSLLQSVGLALMADHVIAADTGPAHLAALLGAEITGCFGPTSAFRTGLRGPRAINVGGTCSGCYRRTCREATRCLGEALKRAVGGAAARVGPVGNQPVRADGTESANSNSATYSR